MIEKTLWVALGGALGSAGRFGLAVLAARWWGAAFPWGTLGANLLGCLAAGALGSRLEPQGLLRLFLVAGVLGGFTTFSAFGLETQALVQRGAPGLAAVYGGASIGLGLAFVWAGQALCPR